MPVFTRCGPWDTAVLDAAAAPGRARLVTESFAHEAAYADLEVHRLLAFARARVGERSWEAVRRAGRGDPEALERVIALVQQQGPLTATGVSRLLGDHARPEDGWGWRRTDTQWMVEYLFRIGRLEAVGRTPQFERRYALTPTEVGAEEQTDDGLDEQAAILALVRRAANAQGIATEASLADHFRLRRRDVAPAIAALRDSGELLETTVAHPAGEQTMLRWHEAPAPAPVHACALVSPFDPLIFFRPRLSSLFDVDYRIGIYTPDAQRTHGYYALPFLLGDLIEARVDLRADRRRGVLEVRESHREPLPHVPARRRAEERELASALADELARAARWQGLGSIEVMPRGDLASPLGEAVRALPAAP